MDKTFVAGDREIEFQKRNLKKILLRHHPAFREGEDKRVQTHFDAQMSLGDLERVIRELVRQNQDEIATKKDLLFQVRGIVDKMTYVLGVAHGRIQQLYPIVE